MHKNLRKKDERLLDFETIKAATEGDAEAMDRVLDHYKPYITKLSLQTNNGQTYIDEELRERLEAKLIAKTLAFKIA